MQKYKIGQRVKARGWVRNDFGTITDIERTYHHRSFKYVWGYKIDFENKGPGLAMLYIPEGYLEDVNPELLEAK